MPTPFLIQTTMHLDHRSLLLQGRSTLAQRSKHSIPLVPSTVSVNAHSTAVASNVRHTLALSFLLSIRLLAHDRVAPMKVSQGKDDV
jgi:hypothetical protein